MSTVEKIRQSLANHTPATLEVGGMKASAVLAPLLFKDGQIHLLFTRRTEHLEHHRGEISFPGGARHPEDANLIATALRETEEEMGIAPADVQILGQLDDFVSVHNYHVVPYVGLIPSPYRYRINSGEIAEIFEIPLQRLRDPAIFHKENWQEHGRVYPICFYTLAECQIWGLTAAILRQLLKRIDAI
jgi:8-oxo-dGTP pyrophosphatase MutT (NUDIX family)